MQTKHLTSLERALEIHSSYILTTYASDLMQYQGAFEKGRQLGVRLGWESLSDCAIQYQLQVQFRKRLKTRAVVVVVVAVAAAPCLSIWPRPL